ncbi:MAG: Fe/S biosis protein NfuA [Thermoleophilaceae bacterium]|jgi:Fe/S biogenesis protein NfuA|nr:Fe/S biosis protein NfuA [Thermoleophilaceae bacterium]
MALVQITEKARQKVEGFRAGIADADQQAMWIEVTGVQAGAWTYNMSLKPLDAASSDDIVEHSSGLPVVIPARDAEYLRGATVDWSDDLMSGGLTIDNPNTPSPSMGEREEADLSGPLPQRVMQVLEHQVNPAIAAHGGSAELVAVEESTAYVRLGGGCVGCGMATVTLSQGISVAITDAIPEIENVVDVTDHASGTNPYYEAAKK